MLAFLVAAEFGLGVAVLVTVPTGRPTGLVPTNGRTVYVVHAVLGLVLGVGAVTHLVRTREAGRIGRMSGAIGFTGVAMAAAGGVLTVSHPVRLVGGGLMLLGSLCAEFGYVIPALDKLTEDAPAAPDGL